MDVSLVKKDQILYPWGHRKEGVGGGGGVIPLLGGSFDGFHIIEC